MRSDRGCRHWRARALAQRARAWRGRASLAPFVLVAAVALVACERPDYTTCGDLVCPEGYECRDGGCVSQEQIAACDGAEDEAACDAGIDGVCRAGYCQIDLCGNGQLDTYPVRGPEECDAARGLLACADVGEDFGLTSCTACTTDASRCESFSWKAAITGSGAGRLVITYAAGVFVARGGQLWWTRGDRWKNATRLDGDIGDVVPVSETEALVVAPVNTTQLGLWHYDGPANALSDTGQRITAADGTRWVGAVALDGDTVVASLGTALRIYRRVAAMWTGAPAVLVSCPADAQLRSLWASSSDTIYAAADSRIVRLKLNGSTFTCTEVRAMSSPPIALGGSKGQLGWTVERSGRVTDVGSGLPRSLDPALALGLDSVVAEADNERFWATAGDDILLFDSGSWWKSTTGSAILRDDLGGRIPVHHPLAVSGARVLAAVGAQEVGLVQRGTREWMTGWESSAHGEVTDMAIDVLGRPWTAMFIPGTPGVTTVAIGSYARPVSGLSVAITSMVYAAGGMYVGTSAGVWRLDASDAGISATREPALGIIRGVWALGNTLYALGTTRLYSKDVGAGSWTTIYDFSTTDCPLTHWMSGQLVGLDAKLFAVCRSAPGAARTSRLVVFTPGKAGPPAVVDVPDANYTRVAATPDGTVFLVGAQGVAARVAAPYASAELLPVERRSPVTGKLSQISETLQDVVSLSDGQVYVAGANQNLFWWNGQRLVRVSASQGGSSSYVALAAFGTQLYAAYESGLDLLFAR